jgi:hypothetical protein
MQNAIETRIPLSELQQLVDTINGNLITAQQLFG